MDEFLQFLIILLPVLSSYIFTSRLFQKENLLDKANILFLILVCQIVIITQVLSLFKGIDSVNLLTASGVVFSAALFLSKGIAESIRSDIKQIGLYIRKALLEIHRNKLLGLFFLAVLLSFLWRAFLIVYVPPNNWDSMAFHLSRVAYWLQHQSLQHYYTHHYEQIASPFTAHILMLWTMIASKLDNLAGFVQFLCYLLSGTLVYRCLRSYLKVAVRPSLTVTLIWYSLPAVVLESTSTQNDLVVAYFTMFGLIYFLLGIEKGRSYLPLSAAALAAAAGTKVTILFFLPAFAALVVIFLLKHTLKIRQALSWAISLLFSLIIFASYNLIQNYHAFKNPLAPEKYIGFAKVASPSLDSFSSNLFQHIFNIAANQSGLQFYLSRFSGYYNTFAAKAGEVFFRLFSVTAGGTGYQHRSFRFDSARDKFSLCEDSAFFGSAGMLIILLAACVLFIFMPKLFIRRGARFNPRYAVFAFLSAGYLSVMSYLLQWGNWESRFMITMMLIGAPLPALIFDSDRRLLKKLGALIIIYSIILLLPATFINKRKPLNLLLRYGRDRSGLRYIPRKGMAPIMEAFNVSVPLESRVAVILPRDSWDYPLFGERLKREIVPANPDILKSGRFDYLLVVAEELKHKEHKGAEEFIVENYSPVKELGVEKRRDKIYEWILYAPLVRKEIREGLRDE